MRSFRSRLVGIACLIAVSGPAGAITFNLRNLDATGLGGLTDPVSGLGLMFSASAVSTGPTDTPSAVVVSSGSGLGVTTSPTAVFDPSGGQQLSIDGIEALETVNLLFSRNVVIRSIEFGRATQVNGVDLDQVRISFGVPVGSTVITLPGASNVATVTDFGAELEGRLFSFSATDDDDVFGIRAITVQEVPLPGALAMMLGGLGALGLVARRRKRASSAAA